MNIEDPLRNFADLKVDDLATARYALKIANDQHFAVIHMYEQMERELARSQQETNAQILWILQQYLTATRPGSYLEEPIQHIPDPLPEKLLPQRAIDAVHYMQGELAIERQRAEAEVADNAVQLYEIRDYLMSLVQVWFENEVKTQADWLYGKDVITIGGTTLSLENGGFEYEFFELDYE